VWQTSSINIAVFLPLIITCYWCLHSSCVATFTSDTVGIKTHSIIILLKWKDTLWYHSVNHVAPSVVDAAAVLPESHWAKWLIHPPPQGARGAQGTYPAPRQEPSLPVPSAHISTDPGLGRPQARPLVAGERHCDHQSLAHGGLTGRVSKSTVLVGLWLTVDLWLGSLSPQSCYSLAQSGL